jgi:hypothetical protein
MCPKLAIMSCHGAILTNANASHAIHSMIGCYFGELAQSQAGIAIGNSNSRPITLVTVTYCSLWLKENIEGAFQFVEPPHITTLLNGKVVYPNYVETTDPGSPT